MSYRSSRHRDQALPHWLEHYNQHRPHSGLENRPPISRIHNLRGQDNYLAGGVILGLVGGRERCW
jgi:transposase InsO family protein